MVLQEFPTRFNHHVGGYIVLYSRCWLFFLKAKKYKKIKNSARVILSFLNRI